MISATTRDLVTRLAELLARERSALADFLDALEKLDRRRGWEELGYANLYDFLVRELRMSKGTAFYRKTAVELVQRYPEVLEALRDGRLCITAVHALSKALTPKNRAEVLPRFFHVSTQEAKAIAAELSPSLDVPRREVVTSVRTALVLDMSHAPNRLVNPLLEAASPLPSHHAPTAAPGPTRPAVQPFTADEHRLHLTVSPEFLRMLESCKKALSHAMPGADAAAVLAQGMKLILARDAKRKGLVEKPRPRKPEREHRRTEKRYIPAEIRRAVWGRDQGKCQWPLDCGGVCGSENRPEIDHVRGFEPGVAVEVEDLRILCKAHNLLHARQVYGETYMKGFRGRRRKRQALQGRAQHPVGAAVPLIAV